MRNKFSVKYYQRNISVNIAYKIPDIKRNVAFR